MKRIITAAAVIAALAFAGSAAAAAPRECGGYNMNGSHSYWTYHGFSGFSLVWNLTTRSVDCSEARSFALTVMRKYMPPYGSRRGVLWQHFGCAIRRYNGEDWDVRCVRTMHAYPEVIHWQGGA
jgi:hypothetical protein